MRTIGVVTVGRSDFGILTPLLRRIQATPNLGLQLIVSGGHLSPVSGWTVEEIRQRGFAISDQVNMLLAADTPEGIAKSMGLGVIGMAQVYGRKRPDWLVLLGDRFEMLAAAVAAVPFKIPIAHIHGGELTQGAMDEAFRHAITKCAHLHFASTESHARRIVQLGEEPWRVCVSGAPSLDNIANAPALTVEELSARLELPFSTPPLLVTYHPVTLLYEQVEAHVRELLAAIATYRGPIVITKPNVDTGSSIIVRLMEEFAATRTNARLVSNLGTEVYFSLMKLGAAMVGNSSSGIIEAASFELPVVNVGLRQAGRPRSSNVIDCSEKREEIVAAIAQATSPEFRSGLRGLRNIYGDGNAARRIVERLTMEPICERLFLKRFHDLAAQS